MRPCNLAELVAYGAGFDRTEVTETTVDKVTTQVIYAGHAPLPDTGAATLANNGWEIKRTIVVENADTGVSNIEETWARGSWDNRASLEYKFTI